MKYKLLFLCISLWVNSCWDKKILEPVEIEISRSYYNSGQFSCDSIISNSELSSSICCMHITNNCFDEILIIENDTISNNFFVVSPNAIKCIPNDSIDKWSYGVPTYDIRKINILSKNQTHVFFIINPLPRKEENNRYLNIYNLLADSSGHEKIITIEVFSDDLSYGIKYNPGSSIK